MRDIVAGHQRLQQRAAERAGRTNDPDELEFLEDVRNTSENIIGRLIALLLSFIGVAGIVVYLLDLLGR